MRDSTLRRTLFSTLALGLVACLAVAQDPGSPPPPDGDRVQRRGNRGPGRGGPMFQRTERKILEKFDADADGQLNREERKAARKFLEENPARGRGFGRPGAGGPPRGGFRGPRGRRGFGRPEARPGEKISPKDVKPIDAPLYDRSVLRTIFVDFENEDWEQELQDFHGTDVEVPAVLTVDGKKYKGCGVHFRGMSSYMMVQAGHKRSLNVAMDFTDRDQRLLGYKTLNLLNCNGDASLLSTVLYSYIANKFMPAPKANLVRVVINGENWGIYTNVQQFNKQFAKEHYGSSKGSRWKIAGSPRGGGGLDYRGEDPDSYGHPYVLKGGKKEKSKKKLIELCRVLEETPPEELEAELSEILDVDELLAFLALDIGLCNSDGYWTRASDYSLLLDHEGRFHVIPHDMNEAFRKGGGFGPGRGRRGPRGERRDPRQGGERGEPRQGAARGAQRQDSGVDPLHGLDDASKPLRSKVLAVPALRRKYLARIRAIADELDWKKLGPVVQQLRELVSAEVERETRGLSSYEDFLRTTADTIPQPEQAEQQERGRGSRRPGHGAMNLREFAEWRRKGLLDALEKAKN